MKMKIGTGPCSTQSWWRLKILALGLLLDYSYAFVSRTKHQWRHPSGLAAQVRDQDPVLSPSSHRTPINADALEQALKSCTSSREARKALESALSCSQDDNYASPTLFGSINLPPPDAATRVISDGDLAIQTRMVNKKYNIMDLIELSGDRDADRASLSIVCLTIASTLSAIAANQNLPGPEILRFLVVWLFSFAPLFFVGYGIATPSNLQALLVSIQRQLFPSYRQRTIQHEAGHFLMGHLLGYPIQSYTANAVKNAVSFYPLKDTGLAREKAELMGFDASKRPLPSEPEERSVDPSFFGPDGRGAETVERYSVLRSSKNATDNPFLKLASINEPTESWPYRGFDEATLGQLAIVSVAGVCAEILAFGNAEGGVADLGQLRQIFLSAETEMTENEVENRIRFALGYTMSQLRRHLGALDAVADVMEKDGSIVECVEAIETCTNVNGQDGILGDYERRRRDAFRNEKAGFLERILLGSVKSIDEEEDRYVVGKQGGGRKQTFRLTGDDPFYAAIGVAMVFFIWASTGGLSLH